MSIIVAIIIFSLLVVIHEWGHYIAAVKCGVHVEEFAIGMGPAIYKRQGKNTLFSIRCLPIGGYCKMDGEEEASDSPDAFCNKKTWQKILIVVAGATMNILSAYLILVIISNFFVISTTEIEGVTEDGYAKEVGILEGDIIKTINGKKADLMDTVRLEIALDYSDDKAVDMTVERDGMLLNFTVPYETALIITDLGKNESEVLKVGSRIEYINDVNIADIKTVSDAVKTDVVTIKLFDDETTYTLNEDEVKIIRDNAANIQRAVGITPVSKKLNVIEAFVYGIKKGNYYVSSTYESLRLIVTSKVSKDQVAGPVGIIKLISDTYEDGIEIGIGATIINLLSFVAMISVNLGVINLLPLPALDGGRFVILLIELIRRKPMDIEKESWVHFIGFILLMILMVVVVYNDVAKIIGF